MSTRKPEPKPKSGPATNIYALRKKLSKYQNQRISFWWKPRDFERDMALEAGAQETTKGFWVSGVYGIWWRLPKGLSLELRKVFLFDAQNNKIRVPMFSGSRKKRGHRGGSSWKFEADTISFVEGVLMNSTGFQQEVSRYDPIINSGLKYANFLPSFPTTRGDLIKQRSLE